MIQKPSSMNELTSESRDMFYEVVPRDISVDCNIAIATFMNYCMRQTIFVNTLTAQKPNRSRLQKQPVRTISGRSAALGACQPGQHDVH